MTKHFLAPAIAALTLLGLYTKADAQLLGTADTFAVLAGSAVTNTGPSVLTGDLGVAPGSAITDATSGLIVTGSTHAGDAVAAKAQTDVTTAYNDLAGRAVTQVLTGRDLGGLTLTPGVYFFSTSAQLTGTLTLNTQGDPNAVFVFQIGTTLTTASNSSVHVITSSDDCNVFWQIGSSATLGTNTTFDGHILALASITANTGAKVLDGSLLARNGAITLDSNTVTVCVTPMVNPPSAVPEPGVMALLLGTAVFSGSLMRRRRK